MILTLNCEEFYNDACESIRAFYPDEVISLGGDGDIIVCAVMKGTIAYASASTQNKREATAEIIADAADDISLKRALKRAIKLSLYKLLSLQNDIRLPWGSLTGIRPTKMVYDGTSYDELNTVYGVSDEKCKLLERIINNQTDFIYPPKDSIDIYIGIPFCRTRCVYCSFATNDATKSKLIPKYMDALVREIDHVAAKLKLKGITPRCLYIGGGTPTALDETNLERLLDHCSSIVPNMEFTVEAGRPDTLNKDKLNIIKNAGVNRISINPQTMNDNTLRLIGRQHTSKDIISCYEMAEQLGFASINMDLIAGLPGESVDDFNRSLNELILLDPDNITVHTLSIKRGSHISEHPEKYPMPLHDEVAQMVDGAYGRLTESKYEPYYLYRQKYQTGNLENVGYCKKGKQCVYNIDIMEETTSIIALGAGAISKRVYPDEGRIERVGNSKSIFDYMQRIDEMLLRKERLFYDVI